MQDRSIARHQSRLPRRPIDVRGARLAVEPSLEGESELVREHAERPRIGNDRMKRDRQPSRFERHLEERSSLEIESTRERARSLHPVWRMDRECRLSVTVRKRCAQDLMSSDDLTERS